jgi:hypothetical protein
MKPTAGTLIPLSIKHFLIQGLLGCLVGTGVGFLNLVFMIVFLGVLEDDRLSFIALWGLCGIIAGAIQGAFLRRATRPKLVWLLLSGIGWCIVGLVDSQGSIPKSTTGDVIAVSLLYGGLAALPQWPLLQRSLSFAAAWLPLSASIWCILGLILRWQSDLLNDIVQWIIDRILKGTPLA